MYNLITKNKNKNIKVNLELVNIMKSLKKFTLQKYNKLLIVKFILYILF